MITVFDASALICLVEGAEPFAARVRGELRRWSKKHPDAIAALSRLSWLERRVRPSRNNDHVRLAAIDAFFDRFDLLWIELTKDVVELATAIKLRQGLRNPDALQATSCLQVGPEHVYLTVDNAVGKVSGLNTRLIS